jgi:hypothetical protein
MQKEQTAPEPGVSLFSVLLLSTLDKKQTGASVPSFPKPMPAQPSTLQGSKVHFLPGSDPLWPLQEWNLWTGAAVTIERPGKVQILQGQPVGQRSHRKLWSKTARTDTSCT